MEVTVKLNKIEVREYIDADFPIQQYEYSELIINDMSLILNEAGFKGVKNSDISVTIIN